MRIALPLIVLSSLLFLAQAGGEEESTCDMKTVEKVFFCEDHEILLPGQRVSNATYYVCEECEDVFKAAGECEACEQKLVKKVSGKDVCPHCFTKPHAAEACTKTYYECGDCGHLSKAAGKCEDCDEAWKKKVSRAVIEYACQECNSYSYKPGNCLEADCEHKGKPLARMCSESGTFPHTTPTSKVD